MDLRERVLPAYEVAFDADFAGAPGGAADGVQPGDGVLLETLTFTADIPGTVTISLGMPDGAYTMGAETGAAFENISIDPTAAAITLEIRDPSIPAVSEWGLLMLVLLTLAAGSTIVIRRGSREPQ